MLVSPIMIARTLNNSWSELLTFILWPKPMLDCRNAKTECLCAMCAILHRIARLSLPSLTCRRCETRDDSSITPAIYPHVTEQFPTNGRKIARWIAMEPVFRPFRNRLRRRLAFITDLFGKLLAIVTPQAQEVRSQRMCPFCGLITPRSKRFCLECGKSLRGVRLERKDARQG